ncbi:tyrosine-protein phosphatase non-receptor type 12-like isoform X3 [Amphiura filiformis]|uniref:tyrosine-protein phosphatase non-receptor type 12-like isoform X3 n=1 Tax=Amphiura filiformis TaxID=82378 RepID=UPI003B227E0A
MSLRENLEGFLAHTEHVRNLLARGEDGYQQEFTALKTQSQRYKTEKAYATKAGENENNIRKNRYKDILPFDYTRIKLPEIEGIVGSDYINASTVKGYSGKNTYVAAQAPLPQTVMDFWRMIWDVNATIIVMSCNEYEMGKHKCERYWVDEGEIKDFNDIKVSMISQRRVQPDFLIRTLKVKRGSEEERVINQFHYTAWPDHGVPNSVLPIIDMVKLVREYQPHDDVPLLIHCSAGCGRTGTICVIDFVFNQLKQEAIGADFSLYELVQEMRRQRPAMVQTRDQYELVHRAVAAMFNKQLEEKFDDYSRVYENVHLKPPQDQYELVSLQSPQMDKPRMPPGAGKVAHSPNQQRKRHSDHNYVNAMPDHMEHNKEQESSSAGTKLKFREFYHKKKDDLKKKTEGFKDKTGGILSKIGDAVKKSDTSSSTQSSSSTVQNPPSGPPPRPPPQIANQTEIIEKTLKNLEKQPDQPFMYNNHDISYPNRVPKPKPPRQPPQVWADRAQGQVSYVPL